MKKNIVFIDDYKDILVDQTNAFKEILRKNDYSSIKVEDGKSETEFIILYQDVTINVYGEEVYIDNVEQAKEKGQSIIEKYQGTPALFVVDLCLGHDNRSEIGEAVGEYLSTEGCKVIYTSGNVNFFKTKDFIRRAVRETVMNRIYTADIENPLFHVYNNMDKGCNEFQEILMKMLDSQFLNEQYFGFVLGKCYDMK